tara:strand:- start:183 stop:494 length:312 start_codon:yes stop_codon:yes gene_type:complete
MKKITYTKTDIINSIKSNNNLSNEESKIMLETVLDSIKGFLLKSEKSFRIEIRNFGIFEIKPTKARDKARNPKTLEIYKVPKRRKISFKPGKIIKEQLKKALK